MLLKSFITNKSILLQLASIPNFITPLYNILLLPFSLFVFGFNSLFFAHTYKEELHFQ